MPSALGVDLGTVRTGIALARWGNSQHPAHGVASTLPRSSTTHLPSISTIAAINDSLRYSPVTTLVTRDRAILIRGIGELIQEWGISLVVIGALPAVVEAARGRKMTQMAQKLARQLHSQYRLPTVLADEALTSLMAYRGDELSGDVPVDQAAAIEILRGYFTQHPPQALITTRSQHDG